MWYTPLVDLNRGDTFFVAHKFDNHFVVVVVEFDVSLNNDLSV